MFDSAPREPPPHPPRLTGLRGALNALRNFGLAVLATPAAGDYDSFTAGDGQVIPVCVLGDGRSHVARNFGKDMPSACAFVHASI